jgi:hypothetical protein
MPFPFAGDAAGGGRHSRRFAGQPQREKNAGERHGQREHREHGPAAEPFAGVAVRFRLVRCG